MSTISGRITMKEFGLGVPDLLVTITDVDPGTGPEGHHSEGVERAGPLAGNRIGSVVTDLNGEFSLAFDRGQFQLCTSDAPRRHIQLTVLAPEGPDEDQRTRVLYESGVRVNAGPTEQYLIRIGADRLAKAGVRTPFVSAGASEIRKVLENGLASLRAELAPLRQLTPPSTSIDYWP